MSVQFLSFFTNLLPLLESCNTYVDSFFFYTRTPPGQLHIVLFLHYILFPWFSPVTLSHSVAGVCTDEMYQIRR